MKQETVWYTRTYRCRNGITERTKYPVIFRDGQKPSKRERKRAAQRASRAGDNAERQVARLLNQNFSEDQSVHLLLTYSDGGWKRLVARAGRMADDDLTERDRLFRAAQKEFENFVRRVQYATGDFKYLAVTSDMDGKTGAPVRLHHHIVIEREALETCREKWERIGFVIERELYALNGDMTPLASYLIRQVRHIPDNNRFTRSRNLEAPEISEPREITRYGEAEIHVPNGALLLYRSPYSRGTSQYVRFLAPSAWKKRRESGNGRRIPAPNFEMLEREQIESRLRC